MPKQGLSHPSLTSNYKTKHTPRFLIQSRTHTILNMAANTLTELHELSLPLLPHRTLRPQPPRLSTRGKGCCIQHFCYLLPFLPWPLVSYTHTLAAFLEVRKRLHGGMIFKTLAIPTLLVLEGRFLIAIYYFLKPSVSSQ